MNLEPLEEGVEYDLKGLLDDVVRFIRIAAEDYTKLAARAEEDYGLHDDYLCLGRLVSMSKEESILYANVWPRLEKIALALGVAYDFDKWVADLKEKSKPDAKALGGDVLKALDVLIGAWR
ncbi:hypothetical protein ES708_12934 [subsurface metagenome]